MSLKKLFNSHYINILGIDYDQAGHEYWSGDLNNGVETSFDSESVENKGHFYEMTHFY